MNQIYRASNSEYFKLNNTWHVEDSPWKANQILKLILKQKIEFKKLAEVGCGAGEILVQLQKYYHSQNKLFYSFDIAPDLQLFWKDRQNETLHFYLMDITKSKEYFDLLLIMDVIEHVEDYFSFIRNIKSKAKLKIFHIPLDISVVSILRNMPMYFRKSVGHIHYFTEETALAGLIDCNYKIIDYIYTPGSIEMHNKSLKSKFLNIFRILFFKINKKWTNRILGGYSILVLAE